MMVIDASEIKKAIKPKADSTLYNMKKSELIEYIRCLENNYNTAVWFNENQARYIEKIGIENVRSQWISVEERLPELGKEVLICDIDDKRNYMDVWSLEYDEDGDVVWEGKNGEWYSRNEATHWMPLPEPPKEGAEG